MKLALEPEERELRDEVREFLAEHCPDPAELPHDLDERIAYLRRWQARCYEAGYVGRAWPAEFGGGGRPTVEQIVVDQEMAAAGAPERVAIVGLDVLGPALLAFGTDEQRSRYVAPILSAEELWSQGFSEPEAGSDLASLRTVAVETRRRLRDQRTEDVGLVGAVLPLVRRARAHRSGRAEAQGHLAADRRRRVAGRRDAADGADHRARRVLRALPRRRARAEGEPARRPGQGWEIAMHVVAHERGTAALPRQVTLRTWLDRLVADAADCSATARRCSPTRARRPRWPAR